MKSNNCVTCGEEKVAGKCINSKCDMTLPDCVICCTPLNKDGKCPNEECDSYYAEEYNESQEEYEEHIAEQKQKQKERNQKIIDEKDINDGSKDRD